jgi:hypothetical protein
MVWLRMLLYGSGDMEECARTVKRLGVKRAYHEKELEARRRLLN